jgi:hypothetical protein
MTRIDIISIAAGVGIPTAFILAPGMFFLALFLFVLFGPLWGTVK